MYNSKYPFKLIMSRRAGNLYLCFLETFGYFSKCGTIICFTISHCKILGLFPPSLGLKSLSLLVYLSNKDNGDKNNN